MLGPLVSCSVVWGVLPRAMGGAACITLSVPGMPGLAPRLVWGCSSMARLGKRERERARVARAVAERWPDMPDTMRQSRGKRSDTASTALRVSSGKVHSGPGVVRYSRIEGECRRGDDWRATGFSRQGQIDAASRLEVATGERILSDGRETVRATMGRPVAY